MLNRVAVVGSGIAGLGAAHALQKSGCEVIVLERSDTVGGRMRTESDAGFQWDPISQFLADKFRNVLSLMEELNLKAEPVNRTMAEILPAKPLYYFGMHQPVRAMLFHPQLSPITKVRLLKLVLQAAYYWRNLDYPYFDRLQMLDTNDSLRSAGDREYGAEAVDYFLSIPSSNLFFYRPEETPWWMPLLARKLTWNFSLLIPKGGMRALPTALAQTLDVRTGHEVTRVASAPNGSAIVQVAGSKGIRNIRVDRVIIATPAPVTLGLLPDPDAALGSARANVLRTAKYTRVITTAVGYSIAPEDRAYVVFAPLRDGLGLSSIGWESRKIMVKMRTPGGCGLAVLGSSDEFARRVWTESEESIARSLIDQAQYVYPQTTGKVLFHKTYRIPYATPVLEPGRLRVLAEARSAGPQPGSPVFTCGDYWLGPTVEQALVTGYRAAQEVLESLGLPMKERYQV